MMVLGWLDAYPVDEVPDENIWHHPQRLEEWFEAIRHRRENGMEPIDEADDADMTTNPEAERYR